MKQLVYAISLIAVISIALSYSSAQADDLTFFTADKATALIGEPIQLVLHIRVPQHAQLILPDLQNVLSPFVVERADSISVAQQLPDGSVEYQLPITVTLWQTGMTVTPSFDVSYRLDQSELVRVHAEGLQLNIVSVLNAENTELRPFKPLVDKPVFPVWSVIILAGTGIGITVIAARKPRFLRRVQLPRNIDLALPSRPETGNALETLRQIERSNATSSEIFVQVSDCLRHYLATRFSVLSLELTTSELTDQLTAEHAFLAGHQQQLIDLLKKADLVKFAPLMPKQSAAKQYIGASADWIQSVDQSLSEKSS